VVFRDSGIQYGNGDWMFEKHGKQAFRDGLGRWTWEVRRGSGELTVCDRSTGINEEEFQKIFAGPVSAKYPDIKMKL
jgi:hypothetical protein